MIASGPDLFAVSLYQPQLLLCRQVGIFIFTPICAIPTRALGREVICLLALRFQALGREGPETVLCRCPVEVIFGQCLGHVEIGADAKLRVAGNLTS